MRTPIRLAAALAAALALAPAARAEVKLGYVDMQRALNEVEEGKAAKASLKRELDEKQKVLDQKISEIKKLQADFDKQALVMTEEVRKTKGEDLDRRKGEIQEMALRMQQELSSREGEAQAELFEKMGAIAREIAEADGFTMIFEKRTGLIYAPASLDLTNELIRKYNARHKPGAEKNEKKKPAATPEPAAKK
jgi:outer membrane protein